nr:hypothetical protein [Tanacetum cinerariifolium]
MSYGDSLSYSSTTTYTAPSNSKTGSHRSGNVIEDVLQSFVVDTKPEQQLAYEDFEQIEKLNLEEMDLKWKMAMLSVRVHKFEQKARRKIDFDKKESARSNKKKRVLQRNQLTLEDKIRVLSIELENTSNLLKYSERIIADVETTKKELQTKLDNHLVQTEKWRFSSKNLFRLIDSSMSVRTNVGLGFNNYIRENELGWDDYAFSVFTTDSEDVECIPLFNRTGKVNIPPARPQPVPTGKPKVFAPVPTGRQHRPFLVPTDRGYSPLVIFGWWKSTARPMPHYSRPTSFYFQTYTPYVPTMYYNHMKYSRDRWGTAVKPSAGCSLKSHKKGYNGYPRTIVDLIRLHGQTFQIHKADLSHNWLGSPIRL